MWKYRHIVKENPMSGYDWSTTGQWQTAFCVCVDENTENVEDLVFSQEDNPKTHRQRWFHFPPHLSSATTLLWEITEHKNDQFRRKQHIAL